jgi:hypothetical protein
MSDNIMTKQGNENLAVGVRLRIHELNRVEDDVWVGGLIVGVAGGIRREDDRQMGSLSGNFSADGYAIAAHIVDMKSTVSGVDRLEGIDERAYSGYIDTLQSLRKPARDR